eukprot:scaffold496_cov236-Pinguiococcus_pyrenoidosus.AAC.1
MTYALARHLGRLDALSKLVVKAGAGVRRGEPPVHFVQVRQRPAAHLLPKLAHLVDVLADLGVVLVLRLDLLPLHRVVIEDQRLQLEARHSAGAHKDVRKGEHPLQRDSALRHPQLSLDAPLPPQLALAQAVQDGDEAVVPELLVVAQVEDRQPRGLALHGHPRLAYDQPLGERAAERGASRGADVVVTEVEVPQRAAPWKHASERRRSVRADVAVGQIQELQLRQQRQSSSQRVDARVSEHGVVRQHQRPQPPLLLGASLSLAAAERLGQRDHRLLLQAILP